MSLVLTDDTYYKNIAASIREALNRKTLKIKPGEMSGHIDTIASSKYTDGMKQAVNAFSDLTFYSKLEYALKKSYSANSGPYCAFIDRDGNRHIVVLKDTVESDKVDSDERQTLHLNGHTITINSGSYGLCVTGGRLLIDGSVANSKMVFNLSGTVTTYGVGVNSHYGLSIRGGEYVVNAPKSTGWVYGIRTNSGGIVEEISNAKVYCSVARGSVGGIIVSSDGTKISDCYVESYFIPEVIGENAIGAGHTIYGVLCANNTIVSNCTILAKDKSMSLHSGASVYGVMIQGGTVHLNDCTVVGDGNSAWTYDENGNLTHSCGVYAISNQSILYINGGLYHGTREGIVGAKDAQWYVKGATIQGCQHGASYLKGFCWFKDSVIKNAAYTRCRDCGSIYTSGGVCQNCKGSNLAPFDLWGDCGWEKTAEYHFGAMYTSGSGIYYFDGCDFNGEGCPNNVGYAISMKYADNAESMYLSNCTYTTPTKFKNILRVTGNKKLYFGANHKVFDSANPDGFELNADTVGDIADSGDAGVDFSTYAGVHFKWEDDYDVKMFTEFVNTAE